MSGMLSSAAVVLSQNTPLWGCGYMQRHLSGQQSGGTCLWSPSCHLWLGSWPWNSLRYTERPGEGETEEKWAQEVKQTNRKKKGSRRSSSCAYVEMFRSNLEEFFSGSPHWNPPVDPSNYPRSKWLPSRSGLSQLTAQPFVRLSLRSQPARPSSYRLARGQASSRKGIPSTVRAAVFVLPNSIPFHSLSAYSVYFGALLHRGAGVSWKTKTSPPTSNPMTWPLEAASSSSAKGR